MKVGIPSHFRVDKSGERCWLRCLFQSEELEENAVWLAFGCTRSSERCKSNEASADSTARYQYRGHVMKVVMGRFL